MVIKYKKQLGIALGFIILLSCLIFGFLYFLDSDDDNIDNKSILSVEFKNNKNNVELQSILPMKDVVGKELTGNSAKDGIQGYLEFTVSSTSKKKVNYSIIVKSKEVKKEIDSNYIKVYLTDLDDKPYKGFESNSVPSYNSLKVDVNSPSNKILLSDSIKNNESKSYKLRVWLSNSYVINSSVESFDFDVEVINN